MRPLKQVVEFNKERNLTDFAVTNETALLLEELTELQQAAHNSDAHGMVDALCDVIVVAAGGLHKLGYDPEIAMLETTKEILSRVGSIDPETGKWKKDPTQDPETLYKADYRIAKY